MAQKGPKTRFSKGAPEENAKNDGPRGGPKVKLGFGHFSGFLGFSAHAHVITCAYVSDVVEL